MKKRKNYYNLRNESELLTRINELKNLLIRASESISIYYHIHTFSENEVEEF